MFKYETIIYWSEEDQVYIAEVPELPGCMAHGSSYELALSSAKEAIQLWIDTANEFGDPIPAPKGHRLMYAQEHIQEIAQKEGVSINQFISLAASEKISAIMTEEYLERRAKRADRK